MTGTSEIVRKFVSTLPILIAGSSRQSSSGQGAPALGKSRSRGFDLSAFDHLRVGATEPSPVPAKLPCPISTTPAISRGNTDDCLGQYASHAPRALLAKQGSVAVLLLPWCARPGA